MHYFLEAWFAVIVVGAPFILLILATILPIRTSNPIAYQVGWLNLLLFLIYSLFVALFAYVLDQEPGSGGMGFAAIFSILPINGFHLVLFWLWLFWHNRNQKKSA